ncbi:unnamed protein product [Parajaminaea phylloscopi]
MTANALDGNASRLDIDWRTAQSSLRSRLRGPFDSVDAVLDVLLPTLHILDLIPPGLAALARSHTPQKVLGCDVLGLKETEKQSWRKAFVSPAWLLDSQAALLGHIAQDWRIRIQEEVGPEAWTALLRAWFLPDEERRATQSTKLTLVEKVPEEAGSSTRSVDDPLDGDARRRSFAALITSSGLQVLASALSRIAAGKAERSQHLGTEQPLQDHILQVVTLFLECDELIDRLLLACHSEANAAKRTLRWQDSVSVLITLPTRVLNASQGCQLGQVQQMVEEQPSRLYDQFFRCLRSQAKPLIPGGPWTVEALGVLLVKLIRNGALTEPTTGSASLDDSFWAAALRAFAYKGHGTEQGSRPEKVWRSLLLKLAERERGELCRRFVVFVGRLLASQGRGSACPGLIAAEEWGKPAAIGRRFLSSQEHARAEESAQLLISFWAVDPNREGLAGLGAEDDAGSDDGDDEAEDWLSGAHGLKMLLENGMLWHWNLGIARALIALVRRYAHLAPETLSSAIAMWGSSQRVHRTTAGEEHYYVLIVLGLLAVSQEQQKKVKSADPHGAQMGFTGASLSGSQVFVEAITVHLDHINPEVRRMGMLLAEIVSEKTHEETARLQGSSAPKKLEFSRSNWDGVGEGKEEARILRAYYHSCSGLMEQARTHVDALAPTAILEDLGLGLQPTFKRQETAHSIPDGSAGPSLDHSNQRRERAAPSTRRLPERKPTKAPALIVEMTDDDSPAASVGIPGDSRERQIESDDELESSDSDSSSDEDIADASKNLAGLDLEPEALREASQALGHAQAQQKKKKPASTSIDDEDGPFDILAHRKALPRPVYISDLSRLLRTSPPDRESLRTALKYGEELIRRKALFALREVQESSIDLVFQYAGLHNTLRIHNFEERRAGVLRALVVTCPRLASGALIEEFFGSTYSLGQRGAILNALASGARELAGLPNDASARQGERKSTPIATGLAATQSLVDGLTDDAASRARKEGEERVPEMRKERVMKLGAHRTGQLPGGSIQVLDESRAAVTTRGHRAQLMPTTSALNKAERYIDVASTSFLFPLMNRLLVHIQEASSRFSRLATIGASSPAAVGWSSTSLFEPRLLCSILDTLAVLLHAARNTVDFLTAVLPEALQVSMTIVTVALPLSVALLGRSRDASEVRPLRSGAPVSALAGYDEVLGAAASLILVALDAAWELDLGRSLLRRQSSSEFPLSMPNNDEDLLQSIESFAAQLFQEQDRKNNAAGSSFKRKERLGNEAEAAAVAQLMGRAGRASAAIVIRIEEMRSRAKEDMLARWNGRLL